MIYTTTELINAIKRNAGLPTSQRKFSTEDFLAFLNESLQMKVVSDLVTMRADYFLETETTALVANQDEYSFPARSIGWKAESVGYEDSSGQYTSLKHITTSQRGMYSSLTTTSSPSAFYIKGNNIVLFPSVGSAATGSLVVDFIRIQNELVETSACGEITSVAEVGTDYQITVDSVPTTSNGVDIILGNNPFTVISRGSSATVAGSDITVAQADCDQAPVAGDWVTETGKTPIPLIPEDMHPLLAMAATIRTHTASGNDKGLKLAYNDYQEMITYLRDRASVRVTNSPNKVVPRDHLMNVMRR